MQAGDGCPLFPKESVSAGKGEGDADDADGPVGRGGVTRSVNAEHPEDPGQMWMNTPHFTPKPGQSQSNHPTQLIGIRNPLDMKAPMLNPCKPTLYAHKGLTNPQSHNPCPATDAQHPVDSKPGQSKPLDHHFRSPIR